MELDGLEEGEIAEIADDKNDEGINVKSQHFLQVSFLF